MKIISKNGFFHKYDLKNKATSNIKIQQINSFLSLNDVRIYLGAGPSKSDIGIVKIHPSKGFVFRLLLLKITLDWGLLN